MEVSTLRGENIFAYWKQMFYESVAEIFYGFIDFFLLSIYTDLQFQWFL